MKYLSNPPDELPIPDEIGKDFFYNDDGSPCCSAGWFESSIRDYCGLYTEAAFARNDFMIRFAEVAMANSDKTHCPPVSLAAFGGYRANDSMSKKNRLTVYMATLATFGYTEGVTNEALNFAATWEKKQKQSKRKRK